MPRPKLGEQTPPAKDLAERLRSYLRSRKVSLDQFAAQNGLSPPTLDQLLAGSLKNPGIATCLKIANGMGLDLRWVRRRNKPQ